MQQKVPDIPVVSKTQHLTKGHVIRIENIVINCAMDCIRRFSMEISATFTEVRTGSRHEYFVNVFSCQKVF